MNRIPTFLLAVVLLGLSTAEADAQDTNLWVEGYPQTGTASGTIVVQGTIVPDKGWTAGGTATVYVWPVGSGERLSYNISVGKDGTWQAVIAKLQPGVEYNVSVQGSVSSGQKAFSVATDPAIAKAAK